MKRSEKAELIYLAIGNIDEELIEEAKEPSRSKMPFVFSKRLIAAAASFLILFASIYLIPNMLMYMMGGSSMGTSQDAPSDDDIGSDDNSNGNDSIGVTIRTEGAILTLLKKDSDIYTFSLSVKKEQEALDVTVKGYYTDSDGYIIHVISTTRAYAELTHEIKPPPKIYVNGTPVTEIPKTVGEYILTVDLSELDKSYVWDNYFIVDPFGIIYK